ncbi:Uncharacterised protein [Streptococcus pneumoniae]|nr:Uncharacterised protein [Streptococcus pneumoniae]
MGQPEAVRIASSGGDGVLGHPLDSVGVVAQGQPVPVHARVLGQVVGDADLEQVPGLGAQQRPVEAVVVSPGGQAPTLEGGLEGCGGEPVGDGGARGGASFLVLGDQRVGGQDAP